MRSHPYTRKHLFPFSDEKSDEYKRFYLYTLGAHITWNVATIYPYIYIYIIICILKFDCRTSQKNYNVKANSPVQYVYALKSIYIEITMTGVQFTFDTAFQKKKFITVTKK